MADVAEDPDLQLPERLFATGRYPGRPRLKKTLTESGDFDVIRNSCFGKLFDLPAGRCSVSGKLIHALLSRQLLSRKKYELWTVFGGQPLRFSLVEFGAITGLPCGEFEEGYDHEYQLPVAPKSYEYWDKLIGTNRQTTLAEVAGMLQNDKSMPSWRRVRLALVLIVDGVLIASTQVYKPTPKYVKMVEDLDKFLAFPWGRESFSWTLTSMKPGRKIMGKCENPVGAYRDQLLQVSFRLVGFPLALQLLAFDAIPSLLEKIGNANEGLTLLDITEEKLSNGPSLMLSHVVDAEEDEKLVVRATMEYRGASTLNWGEWDDETKDRKVDYMVEKIRSGYVFKRTDWPGGDASLPLIPRTVKAVGSSSQTKGMESPAAGKRKREGVRTVREGDSRSSRGPSQRKVVDVCDKRFDELVKKVEEIGADVKSLLERFDKAERRGRVGRRRVARTQVVGCSSTGIKRKRTQEVSPCSEDGGSVDELTGLPFIRLDVTCDPGQRPAGIGKGPAATDVHMAEATDDVDGKKRDDAMHEGVSEESVDVAAQAGGANGLGGSVSMDKEDFLKAYVTKHGLDLSQMSDDEKRGVLGLVEELWVGETKAETHKSGLNERDPGERFVDGTGEKTTIHNAEIADTITSGEERKEMGVGNETLSVDEVCERVLEDLEDVEKSTVDVSDSSPATERVKHTPMKKEVELHKLLKGREVSPVLVPSAVDPAFETFKSALVVAGDALHVSGKFDVTNQFFLDLAEPKKWVTTLHMEVLMDVLGRRHASVLEAERACFASPWLTSFLQGKERSFNAAINKGRIVSDKRLKSIVEMSGKVWVQDVDTVYVPMNWESRHWVGLCINLELWCIEVLDPFPSLKDDRKVEQMMEPIAAMLPYIVRELCPPKATQTHGFKPFVWRRILGLYENSRGGDCGPVTAKFMELHANGEGEVAMSGLNDDLVDIFRTHYAMDMYKELVLPLYPEEGGC